MMREQSFAVLILTHGRADRVFTVRSLRRSGYTGRIVIVIDNEDAQADAYRAEFGDDVVVFDKAEAERITDDGDNFRTRRGVVYARNMCFQIASKIGVRYFLELDDDYMRWRHMRDAEFNYVDVDISDLDAVFDEYLDFLKSSPALTCVAMAQSGDFPGGSMCSNAHQHSRKVMNSFFCDVQRPFKFYGRINEDVNAYVVGSHRGDVFMTVKDAKLQQKQTQSNAGGLTELYLAAGTYVKSFYSVMYHPSAVVVHPIPSKHSRLHHLVRWRNTAPLILPESCRKP